MAPLRCCTLLLCALAAPVAAADPAPLLARRLPATATNPIFGNQDTVIQIFDALTQAFFHSTENHTACFVQHGTELETELQGSVMNVVFTLSELFQGHMDQIGNHLGQLLIAVDQIVDSWRQLIHTCLTGDMMTSVQAVGANIRNMSYIGGHLRANGMDIVHQLSDAVLDFHGHRFQEFGTDLGLAFRRVLLSNCTAPPEGAPTQQVMEQMSGGIIQGFFGPGTTFRIVQAGGQQLELDLHQCVAENQVFFQTTWTLAWRFFAELASGGWADVQNHTDQWTGSLALVLLQLPQALHKCGMNDEQQGMLRHAMTQLNHTLASPPHVVFTDGVGFHTDVVGVQMTEAVQAWSENQWESFGSHLGKLLQELVLLLFPQEYSVDGTGQLHRQLSRAGRAAGAEGDSSSPHAASTSAAESLASSLASVIVVLCVMVALTGLLVAMRSRKTLNMWGVTNRPSQSGDALE